LNLVEHAPRTATEPERDVGHVVKRKTFPFDERPERNCPLRVAEVVSIRFLAYRRSLTNSATENFILPPALRRGVMRIFVAGLLVTAGCTGRSSDEGTDGRAAVKQATPTASGSLRSQRSATNGKDSGIDRDEFAQAAAGLDESTIVDADKLLTRMHRPQYRYHRVKAHDTLSKICDSNGCKLSDLLKLNGIGQDEVLRPGQLIYLPSGRGR
jgi:LysM repeat protein